MAESHIVSGLVAKHSELAGRVGVGYRTYMEYQRGTNAPLAMKAMLNLLALLEDQEIVRVVREWKESAEKN